MLKVGEYVYVIIEHKLKDEYFYHGTEKYLENWDEWKKQDRVIIKCPILNTMSMFNNNAILYNIRFNNEIYQLNGNIVYVGDKQTQGYKIYKYNRVANLDKESLFEETLGETNYFAFSNYEDALRNVLYFINNKIFDLQEETLDMVRCSNRLLQTLNENNSIDADKYDDAVNKIKNNEYNNI